MESEHDRVGSSAFREVALLVALVGSAGTVLLSVAMELKPRPLCYYERTFMFGALCALLVTRLSELKIELGRASLLALPLALGGLGAAVVHVYLELSGQLECPSGIFGIGSAPQQSLFCFLLLTASLVPGLSTATLFAGSASLSDRAS